MEQTDQPGQTELTKVITPLRRAAWGLVQLKHGLYTLDGDWVSAVYGHCMVVVDSDWGEGFRSTERWQILVYPSEVNMPTDAFPAFVIPGCNVASLALGELRHCSKEIYDARKRVGAADAAKR